MTPAPVVHVEIRGLVSDELRSFYAEVFGWHRDESRSIGQYSVCSLGTREITAATGATADWLARSCTFFVQVDDIDETLELIEARGGRRVMDKQVGPPDFPSPHLNVFTKFVDPAGNVVGLVERVH